MNCFIVDAYVLNMTGPVVVVCAVRERECLPFSPCFFFMLKALALLIKSILGYYNDVK